MVFKNAFLFFILFVSFTLTAETVRVSTIEGSPVSFVSSQVLTEIYRRARHELIVTPMPASRATVQSTSGITDGETHRILGYGELHPEVLCVPLSYYCTLTVLFVREDNPAINAPLEEIHNYSVAILKGVSNSQRLTEGFHEVQEFQTSDIMMRFLGLGRVDYALVSRLNGMSILNKLGIEGIKVYDPPLEKTCLYHYLHESKSYLIPQLEKVIAALEESGELEQLIREAEAAALNQ